MFQRVHPSDPAALADIWTDIRRVAASLNVPERGIQLVTRLRSRVEAVAQRAAQQAERPRVACLAGFEPLLGAEGWVSELLALAGGEDALRSGSNGPRAVAPEDLVRAAPAVVILAPVGAELAQARAAAAALAAPPGWETLPAVRAGRLFVADGSACFGRPGPQVAEALEAIAEMLHPAAFRFGHEGRLWERWPAPVTAPAAKARPTP